MLITEELTEPKPETVPATDVGQAASDNILMTIIARIGYMVTRVFIPPFVLSRVGIDGYGFWSTVFILVCYLGVATMGSSNVYVKFIAQFNARRQYQKANELISTGLM